MKMTCRYCIKSKEEKYFKTKAICKECFIKEQRGEYNCIEKKACSNCYFFLPITSFNASNKTEDGYSNICKVCRKNSDKYNKDISEANQILICESCLEEKLSSEFYRNITPFTKACKKCVKNKTSHKLNRDEFKKCKVCGKDKIKSNYNFQINIRRLDYLSNICRECKRGE